MSRAGPLRLARLLSHLERPASASANWRQVLADFGPRYAANGFVGWLFSATAPVAIILSVGSKGGLSEAELSSWIFGVFFVNGLISILFSWQYREPLAFAWTIPGTVLVGPALTHLRFVEVIGAFYATGALMLLLGATGWVRRAMQAVPMPIVMGMVAGVFLRFGIDLVRALHSDVATAAPMTIACRAWAGDCHRSSAHCLPGFWPSRCSGAWTPQHWGRSRSCGPSCRHPPGPWPR